MFITPKEFGDWKVQTPAQPPKRVEHLSTTAVKQNSFSSKNKTKKIDLG